MKNYFSIIFAVIVLIFLSNVTINACWCRKDPEDTNTTARFSKTIEQLVDSSDFVFSGTLVEENNKQLIFKVENAWKGGAMDKITFYSLHNVTDDDEREYFIDSCAYTFQLGKSYLVYAHVTLNGLEVSKCGRTDFLTNAQRDIDELNRQKKIVSSAFNFYNSRQSYPTS